MLFSSYAFLFVFLPLVLLITAGVARAGASASAIQFTLFLCSCVFVGASGATSLVLLLCSLAVNYLLLRLLARGSHESTRRALMVTSVVFNLAFIGAFKYADFLLGSVGDLTGQQWPELSWVLPLAISFYTFQLIALSVDSWRHRWPCPPFTTLALFVTFFPQLVAGPIVRFEEVKHDLERIGRFTTSNFATGFGWIACGLFKKALIADSLAPHANKFFDAVAAGAEPTLLEAWFGTLAYTFQIYFDFSGYSDMAIGCAALFGVNLPANFYSPYRADSIIEFWRRWHMSLSRFLRDYLYVPLGGNRAGLFARWRNVMVTMLLGGLWHGASWNFVVWGGLHGVLIGANHLARHWRIRCPRLLAWPLTFACVCLTWVVFRTQDMDAAMRIYQGLSGLNGTALPVRLEPLLAGYVDSVRFASSELIKLPALAWIALAGLIALGLRNSEQLFRDGRRLRTCRGAMFCGATAAVAVFGIFQTVEFVYFRF